MRKQAVVLSFLARSSVGGRRKADWEVAEERWAKGKIQDEFDQEGCVRVTFLRTKTRSRDEMRSVRAAGTEDAWRDDDIERILKQTMQHCKLRPRAAETGQD